LSEAIYTALMNVISFYNIAWMLFGSVIGLLIGAMPGLTATMGVAVFIPLTFALPPATALMTLAAVYTSAAYGGDITAILINTPGTPDSFFCTFDGYPMTLRGEGARALGFSTLSAFFGGTMGSLALLFLAPPLAQIAIRFGPMDLFLTTMLGITIIIGLTKEAMLTGFISATLGFLLSTVGTDYITGLPRFDMGILQVAEGLPLVSTCIGLFATSQLLCLLADNNDQIAGLNPEVKGSTLISIKDFLMVLPTLIKSSIVGVIVGIIPAAGSTIACGISYNEAKRVDKHPETFGKGNPQGLVAACSANNGVVGGSLVPLLTLGIPGNGTAAIFLGGLVIHGLSPGLELFTKHAATTYSLLIGMVFCQFFILILGLTFAKYFVRITNIKSAILIPIVTVFTLVGAFAIRSLPFDMYVMIAFGLIGYYMVRTKMSMAPFVLAFILGPIAEVQFRRALLMTSGDLLPLLTRPISMIMLVINLIAILSPFFPDIVRFFKGKKLRNDAA